MLLRGHRNRGKQRLRVRVPPDQDARRLTGSCPDRAEDSAVGFDEPHRRVQADGAVINAVLCAAGKPNDVGAQPLWEPIGLGKNETSRAGRHHHANRPGEEIPPGEAAAISKRTLDVAPGRYRGDDGDLQRREAADGVLPGEDQERPVPQVERIGDQTREHEGAGLEDALHDRSSGGTAVDEETGSEAGQQGMSPREGGLGRVGEHGPRDGRQT